MNKCTYPGCDAYYDVAIAGTDPGDGGGQYNGWCYPEGSQSNAAVHDHVTS